MSDKLPDIIGALIDLRDEQRTAANSLQELTSDVREIVAGLARLETRAEANDFREQVLNRLTAIREDIAVNMARVDRVADTNIDIRAEVVSLRSENTALWRMIKALEARVDQIEPP